VAKSEKKGKRRSESSGGEPLALVRDPLPGPPMWQRGLGRVTGARACYGKPIEAHGHVVIPVATLRSVGGMGFGQGEESGPGSGSSGPVGSSGGGRGHFVDARPVGFIDIGPDGVRYQAIEPSPAARRNGAAVMITFAALAAARLLRGRAGGASGLTRRSGPAAWPVRSLRR
jgi:hypothetical protein